MTVWALVGIPIKAVLIYLWGLHRQVWVKTSIRDLWTLMQVVGLGALTLTSLAFVVGDYFDVPRSVPMMSAMVSLGMMALVRVVARLWDERRQLLKVPTHMGKRILIIGAGDAGTLLAREMLRHPASGLVPVGFLDDEPGKRGAKIGGLLVLGALSELEKVAEKTGAQEILIAMPSAPGKVVRQVVDQAQKMGLTQRTMPGLHEILSGKISLSHLRQVNLEDLLRRDPVKLNTAEIAHYIEGRTVLITGAGGSIGSEIVRQVCRFSPRRLVLVGRGESSVYQIEQEIKRRFSHIPYVAYIADVRNSAKLEQIFDETKPQVIFHAAAHKHVPFMEANPDEAVFNNVGGTLNLVRLALRYGIERFVNISTDKAVNPTSVMGASKRVAEYAVNWASERAAPGQSFVSVRFGNVLGSRGSVVPLFQEQIKNGGPITVTHPEMTRFFMTIPEAAQLVLQAGGLGENGRVYVLDMGDPVKIVDLARDVIRLSGLTPDEDIKIQFSGMRPGEKLYEELLTDQEGTGATHHQQIFVAKSGQTAELFDLYLESLFDAARSANYPKIRELFLQLIPTYSPQNHSAPKVYVPTAGKHPATKRVNKTTN
ncbi:MAG: nucleoside-diphosphate sugar epimerase/dehydratase [Meiothermus sp.]|nr:nucleoside-diphosphate sugar epimerase/dehydratase [Meiothermus sp.]